jgi:succinate dehydrogenase / fumarate reductase membrane anchor subunit
LALVANEKNLRSSGLSDFIFQRVSAVILAIYALCVVGWFVANPDATHGDLAGYFSSPAMITFSTLAVGALAAHAWIGMWTVGTDYIRPHYFGSVATACRFIYNAATLALISVYVVWGLSILWMLP